MTVFRDTFKNAAKYILFMTVTETAVNTLVLRRFGNRCKKLLFVTVYETAVNILICDSLETAAKTIICDSLRNRCQNYYL